MQIEADDTTVIQAVLQADVERERLLAEEKKILAMGDDVSFTYFLLLPWFIFTLKRNQTQLDCKKYMSASMPLMHILQRRGLVQFWLV